MFHSLPIRNRRSLSYNLWVRRPSTISSLAFEIADSLSAKAAAAHCRRRTTLYACWEPRAQARFDKAAATQTYEKLLDIWKTADPDFIPAQEARKEFAALNALKN